MRILELFAGIGGVSEAVHRGYELPVSIVAAIDIDVTARSVYAANFASPYYIAELESYDAAKLAGFEADLWWLSPPCLPFTIRGHRKDLADPRNRALVRLVDVALHVRPACMIIENVLGFDESQTRAFIENRFKAAGYQTECLQLCPSDYGWPNRRRRVYLALWRCQAESGSNRLQLQIRVPPTKLNDLIDNEISFQSDPSLYLAADDVARYQSAMDRIDIGQEAACSACFGASYGKSLLQAGSYIQDEHGLRRFSPLEVARCLGFSDQFGLPVYLSHRTAWRLLGNSLSLPIVRSVIAAAQQHCFGGC